MRPYSLSQLICPNSVEHFLENMWGRESALFEGSIASEARSILDLASFEQLLATLNRAHEGWLHLARGGLKAIPPDMVDEQGMLKLQKLRAAFADGETLYLTKAERVCLPLMQLARAVELDLLAGHVRVREPVNAHIFLTPPHSQGLRLHRDEHASFILQLGGSKEWTVYKPSVKDVSSREENEQLSKVVGFSGEVGGKAIYDMRPGDVMYIPERWPHEARALSEYSLHATLRVFPLRWADIFVAISSEHPAFIHALPRDFWSDNPREALIESLQKVIESPTFDEELSKVFDTLERKHSEPKSALPDDGLRQIIELERIDLDTLLVRSAGMICQLRNTAEDLYIFFPGGTIRGPVSIKPVFEYVARAESLRARDLPPLDGVEYDRVRVVRTFVKDGLLRISDARP
jgi:hypothetical protein